MYGVRLALRDKKMWDQEEWRGKNLTGKALMLQKTLKKTSINTYTVKLILSAVLFVNFK